MSGEWDRILRRGEDACARCGRRFGPETDVVTVLRLDDGGFRREDHCAPCAPGPEAAPFSFWRRRTGRTAGGPPRRLDLAYLTEFFKRLDGRDDPTSRRVTYIVALLLLRRRILEETGRGRGEAGEVLRLRLKKEERDFTVTVPELDPAGMAAIEQDLGRLFNLDQTAETL